MITTHTRTDIDLPLCFRRPAKRDVSPSCRYAPVLRSLFGVPALLIRKKIYNYVNTVTTLCFRTLKIIISVKNKGVRKQRVSESIG